MSDCCNCCGFTSLIGVVFFGITALMVKRENAVFLSHKAGMNLHTVTDEQIQEKFMAMIYTAIVSGRHINTRVIAWGSTAPAPAPCLCVFLRASCH